MDIMPSLQGVIHNAHGIDYFNDNNRRGGYLTRMIVGSQGRYHFRGALPTSDGRANSHGSRV